MQEIEMPDYINERPRCQQKHDGANQSVRRKHFLLLLLSFGLLCILQATLNISLRLLVDSRSENRNTELLDMINTMKEEREKLKDQLRGLRGCVSSQRCPAGWREINSRCYFLSSESKTWEDSRKECFSKSADLVVINSEQEQKAVYRLNGEAVLLFWIGLYDTTGTGNFKWVDGSPVTKTFWQIGQPSHGGPHTVEACVEMYHLNSVLMTWNDAPCDRKQRWLCERDLCID